MVCGATQSSWSGEAKRLELINLVRRTGARGKGEGVRGEEGKEEEVKPEMRLASSPVSPFPFSPFPFSSIFPFELFRTDNRT
jgi:hypothetical protein